MFKNTGLRAGTRLPSEPHGRQNLLLPVADRPSAQSVDGSGQLVSSGLSARGRLRQEPGLPAAGSLAQFAPHPRRDVGPLGQPLPDSLRYVLTRPRVPALAPFSAHPPDFCQGHAGRARAPTAPAAVPPPQPARKISFSLSRFFRAFHDE